MNKKNLPLILGLMIPVFMIVLVVASIYVPAFFYAPKYNFIYAHSNYYRNTFEVTNGKVEEIDIIHPPYSEQNTYYRKLYLYDFSTNSSKEISLSEARKYQLNPNKISADGFEINENNSGGNFLFFSSYDGGTLYLKGHGLNKKLNTPRTDNYYSHQFYFLGWVQ